MRQKSIESRRVDVCERGFSADVERFSGHSASLASGSVPAIGLELLLRADR